ncbi:MAG: hypothetical protein ACD_62C00126G0013 [uncultured bacterium]|nr:MAG: hypothetical protein ACD_62C00126G0013 [uncultured bacterium]
MKRAFKSLLFLIIILTIFLLLLLVSYRLLMLDIPHLDLLREKHPTMTSFMYEDENARDRIEFIPLSQVSPHVVRAILASEDDLFFTHTGFNWRETEKAFKKNMKRKKFSRGASTLTQQLARNLFLTRDKTVFRKLREIMITFRLEQTLTKKRILELYLNSAEFGPGIYGIGAACRYHFKNKPRQVSGYQAALLAAVLPNPKRYSKKPYPGITLRRARIIIGRLYKYDLHLPAGLFDEEMKQ